MKKTVLPLLFASVLIHAAYSQTPAAAQEQTTRKDPDLADESESKPQPRYDIAKHWSTPSGGDPSRPEGAIAAFLLEARQAGVSATMRDASFPRPSACNAREFFHRCDR